MKGNCAVVRNEQSATAIGKIADSRASEPTDSAPESKRWRETLRDGTVVLIRPIGEDDIDLERRFIEELSAQSRRYRFLGSMKSPGDKLLRRFTHLDNTREVAFIALLGDGAGEREIGVCRYSAQSNGVTCECAIAVGDEWHGQGLATRLMQHLIDAARRHGFASMFSIDAAENHAMSDLAAHLGFQRSEDPNDATQVLHTLDLKAATV